MPGTSACKTWTTFFDGATIFFWVATKFKGQKRILKIRWRPLALQCLFFLWHAFLGGLSVFMVLIAGTIVIFFFFLTLITAMRFLPTFRYQAGWGQVLPLPSPHACNLMLSQGRGNRQDKGLSQRCYSHIDLDLVPPQVSLFYPISENT